MKRYLITFTGRMNIEAETKEEAIEAFYANILEVFDESNITNVIASEEL